MSERRFSDDEVGKILGRAAALQSGAGTKGDSGTSLEELVKVAGELGIDPLTLQRATREVEGSRRESSAAGTNSVLLEQSIEGEISESMWEQIVTASQVFTGRSGDDETQGNFLSWKGGNEAESLMVSVKRRDGRSKVKILADASGSVATANVVGLIVGLLSCLVPAILSVKLGSSVFPASAAFFATGMVIMACYLVTSGLIRKQRQSINRRTNALLDQIVEICGEQEVIPNHFPSFTTEVAPANVETDPATLRQTL